MPTRRCFAGCPDRSSVLYPFPPKTDVARRDLWIRQFGKVPEKYPQKHLYACRRHFSSHMTLSKLLRKNAYPDVNLTLYDKDKPYTEKYSYYKSVGKPDPYLHDNYCEEWLLATEDCDVDLEYAPINYIVPISNELSQPEDSGSDTTQTADEHEPTRQVAKHDENNKHVKYKRKGQCILKCEGRRSLHILPSIETELERRKKWLYLMGKDPALYTEKRIYVCDLHFDIHMIGLSKLIRNAYPNKNLPPPLIKPIPESLEPQTECLQQCTDYERKYQFPTQNVKMRETWLLNFGCCPELYRHNVYACDRHFSDEMRVGPYLKPDAIPDQNLKQNILHEDNTIGSDVSENCSLQSLDALASEVTISTLPATQIPSATIYEMDATTTIMLSPNVSATTTHAPTQITSQIPTFEQSTQNSSILNKAVMPSASSKSSSPVEYVKMQTLGVFMQHKDGYVVSLRDIFNARDPLVYNKYGPMDWSEPIEPKINIKVHPIPKEIYEGDCELSEADTSRSASAMDMDYTVEDSDEYAPTCNIKRNHLNYSTRKVSKSTQTYDEQQNNGESSGCEDNYDYSQNAEQESLHNIKRKRINVPPNEGELSGREDYHHVHKNLSANTVELNDFSSYHVTEDTILEHPTETYPTESYSLLLKQNNKIVKYKNESNGKSKAEKVIVPDDAQIASKVPALWKPIKFNKKAVTAQPKQQQQQHNTNALTKAVALAESWQQVVQTMQRVPRINVALNGAIAVNTPQQPDAVALAARKRVEEIKQAGEREKLSIQQIAGNLTAAGIGGKQIYKHIGNTTTKNVQKDNPNAFKITNVEIIKPKQTIINGKTVNFSGKHEAHNDITGKQPIKAAYGNKVQISESITSKNRKEIMHKTQRAATTQATIATTTTTAPVTSAHEQPEPTHDAIDKLLAKAKRILDAKNTEMSTNNKKLILSNTLDDEADDTLRCAETAMSFAPPAAAHDAVDNAATPFCVLKCANFRKLYEFPTPDEQTFQRHFWFIQLGLDVASDWRKTLYICEKHFDDTMLLPADNTLNEYAYPCKSLMRQLNKSTATVGTQTCDNAVQYKQKLFDQLAQLQQTVRRQRLEMKRVKVLIRLKQEAVRLVAEIEQQKNAPKLLTICNKK